MIWLSIRKRPHVSGNSSVVEHVERQCDNRFEPIVFDNPLPNIALALPRVTRKKCGTVVDLRDPAPELGLVLHLGEHVCEKQHLPVTGTGYQRKLVVIAVANHKSRVFDTVFSTHPFQIALPTLPIRRVGEHEIELFGWKSVSG